MMTQSLAPFGCFSGSAGKNLKKRLTLLKKTNPAKKIIILRQRNVIIFFVWFVLFSFVNSMIRFMCSFSMLSMCLWFSLWIPLNHSPPSIIISKLNWENVIIKFERKKCIIYFLSLFLLLLRFFDVPNHGGAAGKNFWHLCFVCLYAKFNWGRGGNVFKSSINIIKSQRIGKYDHFLLFVFHCV